MRDNKLFKFLIYKMFAPGALLRDKYNHFRRLLEHDKRSHEVIAELQQIHQGEVTVDFCAVKNKYQELSYNVSEIVSSLSKIAPVRYSGLSERFRRIDARILSLMEPQHGSSSGALVLRLDALTDEDRLWAGNKAFNLAAAARRQGLNVPQGFVITAGAFNRFLEENELRPMIDEKLASIDAASKGSLEKFSWELTETIRSATVPAAVRTDIQKALGDLSESAKGEMAYSVRSSAVGEDGESSYAGLYRSLLNVAGDDLAEAYKEVLASKYSTRALSYRIHRGHLDSETPMAVLVLPMVDAKVSGVMYTRDPTGARPDTSFIHAVWGLGKLLVDGTVTPSVLEVSRDFPHEVVMRTDNRQEVMGRLAAGGGVQIVPVGNPSPATSVLTPEAVHTLMSWGESLEGLDGRPQDIEWCVDREGRLVLLQSRPLHEQAGAVEPRGIERSGIENRVLLSGGASASRGVASGTVHNLEQDAAPGSLHEGAILVAKRPSTDYAEAMYRVGAIVTDEGSAAGHLACVARELGVPALFNTGRATQALTTGQAVTVHADEAVVYEGKLERPVQAEGDTKAPPLSSPLSRRLGRVLEHVTPLNLADPQGDNFNPKGCQSLHDVLRFSHEKAVMEMFSLVGKGGRRARGAKKLRSEIPIIVYLFNLDNGLDERFKDKKDVEVEAVRCTPFRALWNGLSDPKIHWNPDIVHFDWARRDRLSQQSFVKPDSKQFASYAILSEDYLNFHIHFGYHFVIVDTLCGEKPETNYVSMRFAGGGADDYSRFLRVEFLGEILSRLGFKVEKKGDLIDAHQSLMNREELKGLLKTVGILLGSTRVLDMSLKDARQVQEMVDRFLEGDYNLSPLSRQ